MYSLDDKKDPNGVDGLNGAPETRPDVKLASAAHDMLENAWVKNLG